MELVTHEYLESRCIKLELPPPRDCWVWQRNTNGHGYGAISQRRNGRVVKYGAHRMAWAVYIGPIPDDLDVCHDCDNPPCINPDHLFLGTHVENMQDAIRKGRLTIGTDLLPRHGEANGRARLTEPQVLEIFRRGSTGQASQEQLAREFGVSRRTIGAILSGDRWGYLTSPGSHGNGA